MRLELLGLSLAGIAAAVPSADPGLKIVARETFPASVIETIEYIELDRVRVESRVAPAPSRDGTPLAQDVQGHRSARISRCDVQKLILLNYDDRTYIAGPLRTYPGTAQNLLASAKTPEPKSPNVLIETTTIQTGERKYAFGHTATRAITTRRHIPLDATGGAPSQTETDGWYIELETRPSCERLEGIGARAVLLVGTASSNAARPPEVPTVTFKDIGAPERGYPVKVRTTSRSMVTSSQWHVKRAHFRDAQGRNAALKRDARSGVIRNPRRFSCRGRAPDRVRCAVEPDVGHGEGLGRYFLSVRCRGLQSSRSRSIPLSGVKAPRSVYPLSGGFGDGAHPAHE